MGDELYFKPFGDQLMVSPADATPWESTDVHPDDHDIAVGIQRLERMTTRDVRQVSRSWAGLRTFGSAARRRCLAGRDHGDRGVRLLGLTGSAAAFAIRARRFFKSSRSQLPPRPNGRPRTCAA